MSDPKAKFFNFEKALNRLRDGIAIYDRTNDLLRDGLIQRFEFTFELAWKTLKIIFEDEGLVGLNSPKMVFREAFAARLIKDEALWLNMLDDRNSTVHIYNENLAKEICRRIMEKYLIEFGVLLKEINKRIF